MSASDIPPKFEDLQPKAAAFLQWLYANGYVLRIKITETGRIYGGWIVKR